MTVRIDSLGIDRLNSRDRLDLIEQIWDSLPDQIDIQEARDRFEAIRVGLGKLTCPHERRQLLSWGQRQHH